MVNLEDKVALVTGAAGAIGQSIASALAANGARVVYSDIDIEAARQYALATPGAIALHMDVTDEAEVEAVMAEIVERFGALDILVNNAGINTAAHRVNIDKFPTAEWDRILPGRSHWRVSCQQGRCEANGAAQIRPHHQHCLRARARARPLAVRVCRRQGRCCESHAGNGSRTRLARSARELHRTWLHLDRAHETALLRREWPVQRSRAGHAGACSAGPPRYL